MDSCLWHKLACYLQAYWQSNKTNCVSFYDNILSFVTDRSQRISARATVIVLVLSLILLVDNITGFSFYYNKQRQLDQLKSISQLLKDTTISADTKTKLTALEQQTLDRKTIVDYSLSFLKNISLTSSSQPQNIKKNNAKSIRNDFWFLVSSSGLYILVTILLVPVILFTDKKTPFFRLLATLIIFVFIMTFTAWFNYWLFDIIIPDQLFGSWTWNYVANFLLQIGLVVGLFWAGKNIQTTKWRMPCR